MQAHAKGWAEAQEVLRNGDCANTTGSWTANHQRRQGYGTQGSLSLWGARMHHQRQGVVRKVHVHVGRSYALGRGLATFANPADALIERHPEKFLSCPGLGSTPCISLRDNVDAGVGPMDSAPGGGA